MKLNKYEDLKKARKAFLKKGFTQVFDLKENVLINKKSKKRYPPQSVEIVEYHRFQHETINQQTALILALECKDKTKGLIISSFKEYADMQLIEFMNKAKIKSRAVKSATS